MTTEFRVPTLDAVVTVNLAGTFVVAFGGVPYTFAVNQDPRSGNFYQVCEYLTGLFIDDVRGQKNHLVMIDDQCSIQDLLAYGHAAVLNAAKKTGESRFAIALHSKVNGFPRLNVRPSPEEGMTPVPQAQLDGALLNWASALASGHKRADLAIAGLIQSPAIVVLDERGNLASHFNLILDWETAGGLFERYHPSFNVEGGIVHCRITSVGGTGMGADYRVAFARALVAGMLPDPVFVPANLTFADRHPAPIFS